MRLRRSVRDRQHREQPLDEAEVILFLKRPDTSSHGFTLGLCDSLHGKELFGSETRFRASQKREPRSAETLLLARDECEDRFRDQLGRIPGGDVTRTRQVSHLRERHSVDQRLPVAVAR
jgi:hypothetical protein